LIFAPKKFKNPARLFDPSKNPLIIMPTDHASDMRALQDVLNPLVTLSVMYVGEAVGESVIVAQSRKFFSTLFEIPTGQISLVIVAQSRMFFNSL
jgi:hypothetical protein